MSSADGTDNGGGGPSLGEYLRNEREQRGITIEQVASATKIAVRLLQSLESDHYADLPAKPFIRGFVTSYCRFIGLDSKETLTRFNHFVDQRSYDRPSRESGHSGYAFERKDADQSRTVLWLVMSGFIVVGGLLIFLLKPTLKHKRGSHLDKLRAANGEAISPPMNGPMPFSTVTPTPTPTPVLTQSPTPTPSPIESIVPEPQMAPPPVTKPTPISVPSPTPTPTPVVTSTPNPTPTPTEKPDPLDSGAGLAPKDIRERLVIRALSDVWVRYKVDERPPRKFILLKDKLLILKAKQLIRFQVSDPTQATFSHNGSIGKPIQDASDLHTVDDTATLIFPANLAEKVGDPFPNAPALKHVHRPTPEPSSPVPTPTP